MSLHLSIRGAVFAKQNSHVTTYFCGTDGKLIFPDPSSKSIRYCGNNEPNRWNSYQNIANA